MLARERGEWSGIPLPLDGERLIIEPTYPKAKELMSIGAPEEREDPHPTAKIRNRWWSDRLRAEIYIWEEDGKIDWGKIGRPHHIALDLQTLGCSDAWGIEQEASAVQTLAGLIRHRQFKQYMLTGMFLERSQRSGVSYIFRRLRPTVAIRPREKDTRILAALCLHPIGYYGGSWAGAMCPTDDVIAHLMLMRGDEAMFWRRANQHAPDRPEAAL